MSAQNLYAHKKVFETKKRTSLIPSSKYIYCSCYEGGCFNVQPTTFRAPVLKRTIVLCVDSGRDDMQDQVLFTSQLMHETGYMPGVNIMHPLSDPQFHVWEGQKHCL